MEKLIGKWEVIREASEGEEVYLDKNEVPQEDRQVMQTIVWTQTFSQDGDEWVSETEAGDVKDRFKFTLGTEITHTTNTGKTIVGTLIWNDGRLLGSFMHDGKSTTTLDYLVGDTLYTEFTRNGATVKYKFRKV
ncbi:retinol-binding protein 2-like [Pomacea canaliculata]|uniref:retinol-binding protein 2-like n=1 Tax=Pomacea canaliculata TaxID=400727 RepID=UPI000D73A953|nr:retinol-binding protein 2-like [Pomacea canaliculata]